MTGFLISMQFWHWLIFGGLMLTIEILAPSTLLLWPGLAAIFVGLLMLVMPGMAWTMAIALWSVLSVVTVAGWVIYRQKHPKTAASSTLNRRGEQYVGHQFSLTTPVANGKGEMRVDDTVWKIVSDQDLAPGSLVSVVAVEGTSLRVVPLEKA